jgi:hypothetical protein
MDPPQNNVAWMMLAPAGTTIEPPEALKYLVLDTPANGALMLTIW